MTPEEQEVVDKLAAQHSGLANAGKRIPFPPLQPIPDHGYQRGYADGYKTALREMRAMLDRTGGAVPEDAIEHRNQPTQPATAE